MAELSELKSARASSTKQPHYLPARLELLEALEFRFTGGSGAIHGLGHLASFACSRMR
jgi:hypothetical protein